MTIDPSLLAGAVVEVGDLLVDGTARHRLDELRRAVRPRPASARLPTRRPDHTRGTPSMTELSISADEITAALRRHVEEYTPEVGTEQVGRDRRGR